MNPWILVLTHGFAAIAGGAFVYLVALRAAGEPPHLPHLTGGNHMHDDDSALEHGESLTRWQRLRRWLTSTRTPPTWLIIVIASAFVVAIGISSALAQADNKARDHDREVQQAADRDRQECLNEFAADLVSTLQAVRAANLKVAAAQERKDAALDDIFVLLAANNQRPPGSPAEEARVRERFANAVAERVASQRALDRAKRDAAVTQAENPYKDPKTPKAVC